MMSLSRSIADPARGRYRGRFAPSPTGPLHFGSLVAAVGSYLDARASGGEWLLRIEDVDQPRTLPGAADNILRTLAGFGFEWDGEVLVQSRRLDLYRAALVDRQVSGDVYACALLATRDRRQFTARVGGWRVGVPWNLP
jgi:glutamyl-Q tRNA(Asp) synthetase